MGVFGPHPKFGHTIFDHGLSAKSALIQDQTFHKYTDMVGSSSSSSSVASKGIDGLEALTC